MAVGPAGATEVVMAGAAGVVVVVVTGDAVVVGAGAVVVTGSGEGVTLVTGAMVGEADAVEVGDDEEPPSPPSGNEPEPLVSEPIELELQELGPVAQPIRRLAMSET